jgi:hypothetical protein
VSHRYKIDYRNCPLRKLQKNDRRTVSLETACRNPAPEFPQSLQGVSDGGLTIETECAFFICGIHFHSDNKVVIFAMPRRQSHYDAAGIRFAGSYTVFTKTMCAIS